MYILGISTGIISSAALIKDGEVVCALAEERKTRKKRTRDFPINAIKFLLSSEGISLEEVDYVAQSWNPAINLLKYKESYSNSYRWIPEMLYATPNHLLEIINQKDDCKYVLQKLAFTHNDSDLNIYYVQHHLCHAALSYYLSSMNEAAILTVDGFGENACCLLAKGSVSGINKIEEIYFPHSLGAFYETMTEFLGFIPDSDEWKVMGMAAYGNPSVYQNAIEKLVILKEDGKYELDLTYFEHYNFDTPKRYSPKMEAIIGKARDKHESIEQRHYDIAASVQLTFEKAVYHLLNYLFKITNLKKVCLSGGAAMNCVMNGKIVGNTPFEEVFIPYAPDDSGNSIGGALYLHHNILGRPYNVKKETSSYLGRSWSDKEIKEILDKYQVSYIVPDDLYLTTVKLIKDENIVGWFQGRAEFGQRALGNRSILATPLEKDIKRKINAKIKYREDFRPFAPSILEERVRDFFDITENVKSPYMEQVFPVKKEMQSKIPAVVHNDGTGRVHMVSKKTNTEFYRLIEAFESLTTIPILLNTSFNVSGEPIVNSPEDALRTFTTSGLDVLVIGKYIITKK